MPELPEVQVITEQLNRSISGKKIIAIQEIKKRNLRTKPKTILEKIGGIEINAVKRRGKYILITFNNSKALLITHLRMTGKYIVTDEIEMNPYNRVIFNLAPKGYLIYHDLRRFGTIELSTTTTLPPAIEALGIEPTETNFTVDHFYPILAKSKKPIKHLLMDQSAVAGIGNIYASEILFAAQIHPKRISHSITQTETKRLIKSIQRLLKQAIECNGTTISDFRSVDDKTGRFQKFLRVYGKTNQACSICQCPIQSIKQQQRTSFFCPECQK